MVIVEGLHLMASMDFCDGRNESRFGWCDIDAWAARLDDSTIKSGVPQCGWLAAFRAIDKPIKRVPGRPKIL